MNGTTGLGIAVTVLIVVASLVGLWALAVSALHRAAKHLREDLATPTSTTTIHEIIGRDNAEGQTQERNEGQIREPAPTSDH